MQSLAEYFRKPTPEEERLLRGEALDMSLYQSCARRRVFRQEPAAGRSGHHDPAAYPVLRLSVAPA